MPESKAIVRGKDHHPQAALRARAILDAVAVRTRAPARAGLNWTPSQVVAWGILYMAENFHKPIALEDVARQAGMSKFHFLRTFRSEAGITPGTFLQHCRIAEAMERLEESDEAIGAIAAKVGYKDAAAFSRAFGRITGRQPRHFRSARQHGSLAAPALGHAGATCPRRAGD